MIYWRHTYYKMHSLKKWVHQLLLISDLIIWLLLDYFLWKPCTTPAFDVIFEKSASSFTIPAWWPYKWVKLKIVANSFLAELRKVFFSFSFLAIFLVHSPTSSSKVDFPQHVDVLLHTFSLLLLSTLLLFAFYSGHVGIEFLCSLLSSFLWLQKEPLLIYA